MVLPIQQSNPDPIRALLDQQLRALGSVCSCRANAQCRSLMDQLAALGALPATVLSMSDEEWIAACTSPDGQAISQTPTN